MMKHGKSISVEELFESVRCALRCRWRRKQALLLLSLQTGEVAYWQNGEHSWQEQLKKECLADKQSLTDELRELLLQHEVERMLRCLFCQRQKLYILSSCCYLHCSGVNCRLP